MRAPLIAILHKVHVARREERAQRHQERFESLFAKLHDAVHSTFPISTLDPSEYSLDLENDAQLERLHRPSAVVKCTSCDAVGAYEDFLDHACASPAIEIDERRLVLAHAVLEAVGLPDLATSTEKLNSLEHDFSCGTCSAREEKPVGWREIVGFNLVGPESVEELIPIHRSSMW